MDFESLEAIESWREACKRYKANAEQAEAQLADALKERDALLERLEAADQGDIWVAFTKDGLPRDVIRQTFEPTINPRVGRWVRCVQSHKLGGRDE